MKIKLNPLYVFLVVVACLPFVAVWIGVEARRRSEAAWRPVVRPWIQLELPGEVVEEGHNPRTGIRFLAAGTPARQIVAGAVPAPPGGALREAIRRGAPAVAAVYLELFAAEPLTDLDCRLDAETRSYHLAGRRRSDNWFVAGRLRLGSRGERAFVLLVATPRERLGRQLVRRIARSARLRGSGGEGPEAPAAAPERDGVLEEALDEAEDAPLPMPSPAGEDAAP